MANGEVTPEMTAVAKDIHMTAEVLMRDLGVWQGCKSESYEAVCNALRAFADAYHRERVGEDRSVMVLDRLRDMGHATLVDQAEAYITALGHEQEHER